MIIEPRSSQEDIFPACNIQQFVFSNPFTPSSPLVHKIVNLTGEPCPTVPPVLPHKPIFVDAISATAIAHSRLKRDSLRLAHGIHQRFGPPHYTTSFGSNSLAGPVVLIHLPNCTAWPTLVLGFIAAGWTVTMTNPAYTPTELAHIIALCEPHVVVCLPGKGGEDNVRVACSTTGIVVSDLLFVEPDEEAYGLRKRVEGGAKSWMTLLSNEELDVSLITTDDMDRKVALLLWTSGTTGKPKGAMMTHRAVIAGVIMIWRGKFNYLPDERWIGLAPFYHIYGLYTQVLLSLCIGATVIIYTKFDLENYLRAIKSYQITHLNIAPPIAVALAKSPLLDAPWCSLASVKTASSGGAPLASEIVQEVWQRTGIVIKSMYGMSELGPVTAFGSHRWEDVAPYLGSTGTATIGVQVRIVDKNKKPVKNMVEGEIVVHSPAQMLGYLKNQRATAEMLDELGIHTGDLGYFDERGNLWITGRLKELIKYKGFQVSPTELEGVIATLSSVQDVAVSSVYSNAEGTELPMAYVVPQGMKEAQLTAAITAGDIDNSQVNANGKRGKNGSHPDSTLSPSSHPLEELIVLAEEVAKVVEEKCVNYKRLRGGVVIVNGIPKSASGKIMRSALKDQKGFHVQVYKKHFPSRL